MKKRIYKTTSKEEIATNLEKLNEEITGISEDTDNTPLIISRKREKVDNTKSKKSKLKVILIILLILGIILGVCYGYFLYLYRQGEKKLLENITDIDPYKSTISEDGKIVTYNKRKYERNDNIVSFLIMGIDDIDNINDNSVIGDRGQADTLLYGTLDVVTGDLKLLNISRDSMVDVDLYNVAGEYVGTEKKQICLAYSYGIDDKTSCENVKKSVTRLLFNAPIDFYIAIDFPAVSVLTDAIGGVTVNVIEDLSQKDSQLKEGNTVTLDGKQAMTYVRSRNSETLDSNSKRMLRQKQYIIEFLSKLQSLLKQRPYMVLNLYQTVKEYVDTDLELSELLYLSGLALNKSISPDMIQNIEGELKKGSRYAEFYVNEDDVYDKLLNMLYIKNDTEVVIDEETETITEKSTELIENVTEKIKETEVKETEVKETEIILEEVNYNSLY